MRTAILALLMALLSAAPVVSTGVQMIKLGGLPAEVEEGRSIAVGLRAFSFDFIEPGTVRINGGSITIDLVFWACPITCEGELYDYRIPLGQLPANEYTVEVELDGVVLAAIEFEVVG